MSDGLYPCPACSARVAAHSVFPADPDDGTPGWVLLMLHIIETPGGGKVVCDSPGRIILEGAAS